MAHHPNQEKWKTHSRWASHTLSLLCHSLMNIQMIYFTSERDHAFQARPRYRRSLIHSDGLQRGKSIDEEGTNQKNEREASHTSKLVSERSRTLKWAIQQSTPMQVKDIVECMVKGNCKKLSIKLPAWSILQCLLELAKSDSSGLVISNEVELTMTNWPKDKVFEWFVGPLLIIKEQIKGLQLKESEEICLRKLIVGCKNERPEEWDDTGFPSNDNVRRAQLQAIIRRLQGIVGFMSRMPTFRRRFRNLVKVLYIEAIQTGLFANQVGGSLKIRPGGKSFLGSGDGEGSRHSTHNNGDIV